MGAQHQWRSTRQDRSLFLPMQMPSKMQEVGLPAGRCQCLCSAPCGQVPGCSSCRSEPCFLAGLSGRESREAAHHTSPPEQGEHSVNPPSSQTPTALGELLALPKHPPTGRGEGKKPPSHMLTGRQPTAGQTLPSAQPKCMTTPGLCNPVCPPAFLGG